MWWTDANGHIWNGEHCDRCGWANWHPAGGKPCDGGEHVHKMTVRLPDEAKVAAPAQKPNPALAGMVWHDTTSGKIFKRECGAWMECLNPATPMPTPAATCSHCQRERDPRKWCPCAFDDLEYIRKHRGVPDPVSDFIARRKAKRESVQARDGLLNRIRRDEAIMDEEKRTAPLARAMSTPLPHDPPMSVRLMPYRSKEP